MRNRFSTLVLALALVATTGLAPRSASAYGGRYRGPVADLPPDQREPTDPPPADDPTPPAVIGCSGPELPDTEVPPETDGPTVPDASSPHDPPPFVQDAEPPRSRRARPAYRGHLDDWTFWWEFNADVHAPPRPVPEGALSERFRSLLESRVVPDLRGLLRERDGHYAVRAAAALALARIGDEESETTLLRIARGRPLDGDGAAIHHRVTRECATLALGLLPGLRPESRTALVELHEDSPARGSFVGSYAAIALGLRGDELTNATVTTDALLRTLARLDASAEQLAAAVTGLGLQGSERAFPRLLAAVTLPRDEPTEGQPWPDTVVAHAVHALGEIGSTNASAAQADVAVSVLMAHLHGRRKPRTSRHVRASVPGALARLAPRVSGARQREITERLRTTAYGRLHTGSLGECAQALIALGTIASRPDVDPEVRRRCVSVLRHAVGAVRPRTILRPHALLALARVQAVGHVDTSFLDAILREVTSEARRPFERAPAARALVIAGTEDGAEQLARVSASRIDSSLVIRHVRVAHHRLVGSPTTRAAVLRLSRSALRRDRLFAARALGGAPDEAAVDRLFELLLDRDEADHVRGEAARSLGRSRDLEVVGRLLEIATKPGDRLSFTGRALAVAALGHIGARPEAPDLERLAAGRYHRALTPALQELLGIL